MRPYSLRFSHQVLTATIVALVGVNAARAWGPEGHSAVARIAASNLTAQAQAEAKSLLTPHETLAVISSWADDVRTDHPETGPWHFIDIPLTASTIDMERECAEGNCVVHKIEEFESVLKNKSADAAARREALEFLVHFMGDLHQPLHASDNNDQGGNKVQVIFLGQPGNLHAVWDSGIIRREKLWGDQLATTLEQRITPEQKAAWKRGSVSDWALESHALAVKVVYGKLPAGSPPNLSDDYTQSMLPVVEEQIEKAGIRLAYLLNQALSQ